MNDVRDEDLKRVSPSALEAYLRRRKEWHRAGSMADEVGTFYELTDGDEAVVVPASSTFADYSVRMAENVAVLAAHEDRERTYVLEDLLAAHDDVVRVSVGTSKSRPSLALADGSALLETSRKLLVAAARSAEHAEWAHVGRAGKHVEEYLRSVRFGHTERGSLVLPIYSPVEDVDAMGDKEVPLGRRAVETLVSALEVLQNVTRERSGVLNWSEWLDAQCVERGVSANLCSALSSLIEIGQGVALSVSWALTHAAPRTTDFRVRFRPQDKEKLDEMASRLSSADASPPPRSPGVSSAGRRPADQGPG